MITALDMTSSCDVIMWLTLSDICNFHVQSTSQNFSLFSFLKSQFIIFAQKGLQIEAFWLVDYLFDSWLDHKLSFWKPTSGNLVSGFFDPLFWSTWCWCVANSNRGTNWESISLHIPVLTSDSNIESPVWSSKIEINSWAVFFHRIGASLTWNSFDTSLQNINIFDKCHIHLIQKRVFKQFDC